MKKLFGYDSKFMRTLGKFSDMLFLNALFLICCIPVITIGAAQSALYSGMRALQDNYDGERTCYGAFFYGLKTGFLKITIAWTVVFSITSVSLVNLLNIAYLNTIDPYAPVWLSIMAVVISGIVLTPIPLFHSRFGCTAFQLIRNAGVIAICNPFITLLQTVLLWIPIIVLFCDISLFVTITPLWLLGYYSFVSMIGVKLFNASFRVLEEHFLEQQKNDEDAVDAEDDQTEDEEADDENAEIDPEDNQEQVEG